MEVPFCTTIIPLHNHQDWIPAALHSVLSQDYPWGKNEIIVVDDGSTDNSYESACRFLDDVVRAKVIHLDKPHGPSYARNRGMEAADPRSEVFFFLDSDDEYLPGKMRQSVEIWQQAQDVIGMVYSDYVTLSIETGRVCEQQKWPFDRRLLLRECIPNCDSLVSKKAIQEVGGFDQSLRVCEDYDLWLRISEKFLIHHIAEPLIQIRVGNHSSTSTVSQEEWNRNYARVIQKHHERNLPVSA